MMRRARRTNALGFSLLELLIALSVLAVLAAFAITSYRDHVVRSGRAEAIAALIELAQRQEEYFGDRGAYTDSMSTLNYESTTPNGLYQLDIALSTTVGYVLEATAINAQARDNTCRVFELNGMGLRSAKNAASGDTTAACWER